MAAELTKAGVPSTREGNLRIKVANGEKTLVNETFSTTHLIGGHETDPIKFFALQNLPFDILIGNPALKEWGAELSWQRRTSSPKPKKGGQRIETSWRNFQGQHWRAPVSLIATVNTILTPFTQTRVRVQEGKWVCERTWVDNAKQIKAS